MPSLFLGGWKGFSQGESSFGSAGKRIEPISLIGLIKQLFIVPGAEHGMSYLVDKEAYEKAVTDFWKECENKK